MSYCKEDGKDRIVFVTPEDHKAPSTVTLSSNEDESEHGLIMPNGDINWNCPCLGGMAAGPCGYQFRSAFSCFHRSDADPKGSDCYDEFRQMQECMSKYPTLYGTDKEDEDREDEFAQLEKADALEKQDTETISRSKESAS